MTQSINSFPTDVQHLESPCVLALRPHHIETSTYLCLLQRIFPQAEPLALGALGAWVLLKGYLDRVLSNTTVGCRVPDISSLRKRHKSTEKIVHGRTEQKFKQLAAKSNECLSRIPTRARAMLGISSPDLGGHSSNSVARPEQTEEAYEQEEEEEVLMSRVRTVMPSVRVVAQRLVEVAKGGKVGCVCDGNSWDEALWRSLTVLLEGIGSADSVKTLDRGWL